MNVGHRAVPRLRHLVAAGPGSKRGQPVWCLWWTKLHFDRFFSKYFRLPLSVSFHQCSTLIVIFKAALERLKTENLLRKVVMFQTSEGVEPEIYFHFFVSSDLRRLNVTLPCG
jgi:hypothetical protein